jgi:NADPH2:quinone reductase
VTTVSTEAKAQVAADAGVPVIVNYRSEGTADRIMQATGGRGVDRISEVDFGGNLRTTLAVMKPSCDIGAYASKGNPEPTLPFYPLLFNNIVVRFIQCHAMPKDLRLCGMRDLARWCEQGSLSHPATKVLPLDEAATAHELVEQGAVVGKILLSL